MKTNIFHFFEMVLTILIGACGLTLLIGGICMGSPIPIMFGCLELGFSIVVPRL